MPLLVHLKARTSRLADIEESIRRTSVSVGAGSVIDSFVKINPAGGIGDVINVENVTINSECVIYTGNGVTIGGKVAISANCTLAPVKHAFRQCDTLIRKQGFQASRMSSLGIAAPARKRVPSLHDEPLFECPEDAV